MTTPPPAPPAPEPGPSATPAPNPGAPAAEPEPSAGRRPLVRRAPARRHPGQHRHGHGPRACRRRRARRAARRVHQRRRAARVEQLLLRAGQRDREGLGRRGRDVRRAVRGVGVQPAHRRGAVPAGLDLRGDPRRLPVRRVRAAVGDRRAGDPADPDRPRGGAAVPGGHVQHRRAEPVHRRRDPGDVARLRRQPAVLRARGGLRARRVRRRRGDRLAGGRDQGAHRGARGDRHDHAQLRHGVLPRLPAVLEVADAGSRRVQHHHPGDRVERAPAADRRHPPAHQRRLPDRARLRVRRVVAAQPDHHRVRVPQRRRQRQRVTGRRDERGAQLGAGDG